MKDILLKTCVGFLLELMGSGLYAQEGTTSSGGEAGGAGGTVSYSLGQVVYVSHGGSGGRVDPGVEHGYEILATSVDEPGSIPLKMTAYPNPAGDYLVLETENGTESGMRYQVSDLLGHIMAAAELNDPRVVLDSESWETGTYILNVTKAGKTIRSFTILKKQAK